MKLLVLIQREYRERVRNKTFIISTLIGLIVILGLSFAPAIMNKIRSADKYQVKVLEKSGQVSDFLAANLKDTLPNGEPEFSFEAVIANASEWSAKKSELVNEVVSGQVSAFVEVSPPGYPDKVIWHTKNINLGDASTKVRTVVQQLFTQEKIKSSGLSPKQLADFFTMDFNIKTEGLKAQTAEQHTQNMALVYFLLFMLYFSLMVYGMYVANGVIEEKSSRVMEMMVASVDPSLMMTAKIIGIGAVGLTQYFIWIGTGLGLLLLKGNALSLGPGMNLQLTTVNPTYLAYFGIFFVLGFLLYATMYAGIGALVSRVEDTNQAVSPLTFLIVIAFMLAMFSLLNPDNPWIVVLSYVPFFTPMVLFARIVLTQVSTLSILLGILDMTISTVILIWLSSKVYRVGVLMYGKVSWRDIIKLIRQH